MPDFRIADTAPDSTKLQGAGLAAIGLWAMCGAVSMRSLSDGFVAQKVISSYGRPGRRAAEQLVAAGLWVRANRDGVEGYQFHDWLDYQRSADEINEARQKARKRMSDLRRSREQPRRVRTNSSARHVQPAQPVRPNTPPGDADRTGERAPNVRDSLTLTQWSSGGFDSPPPAHAINNSPREEPHPGDARPAERCAAHRDVDGDPGPCRACQRHREAAEQHARGVREARAIAVRHCPYCDGDGYRFEPGRRVPAQPYERCDHTPPRKATG